MSVSLRYKPTESNEANKPEREQEQTKFAKPDAQSKFVRLWIILKAVAKDRLSEDDFLLA